MAGLLGRLFGKKAAKPTGPKGTAVGFLDGELTFVQSSNVLAAQFHAADQTLMVEFKNGRAYLYKPVSEAMAVAFITGGSRGGFVWDHFRVRGPGGDAKTAPGITCTRIK